MIKTKSAIKLLILTEHQQLSKLEPELGTDQPQIVFGTGPVEVRATNRET